jgi:hypothetical protein
VLFPILIYSQVIPPERQVNWSDALKSYEYNVPVNEVNVMDFGATGNGVDNDRPAVLNAIASLNGNLGYVYFPPGNYLLTGSLSLPDSVILKGFSSETSVLKFNFSGSANNCIQMSGTATSVFVRIDTGFVKGSSWIKSDSAFLFSAGDYAEIIENNGSWNDKPADWALNSVGQIVQIDYRNNDTLFLKSPLRITYDLSLIPRIRKINPLSNAGLECLKIMRLDSSSAGSNIAISLAANCHIRGIESNKSVSAHVDIFQSTRILVEGCYFHHAFKYDGGSKRGYGVILNSHSGECLVTNNIFDYLRHAMMVKTGANGNVFSYNYSNEVYRNGSLEWPTNYGGDISLHGHFAYANLFEGNIIKTIQVDLEWGPSGPYNTFFRNRAEGYGIVYSSGNQTLSNSHHIIGNDVDYNGLLLGPYTITGTGHIQHGNNVDGVIKPPGTGTLTDTSYYLTAEPVFWSVADGWPSLGIPNVLGAGTNPANYRWDNPGSGYTICPCKRNWTGLASADWDNPHNWQPYGVPEEAAEVTVPQSVINNPQVSSGTIHKIRSITIGQGTGLQLLNGTTLKITR